MLYRRRGDKPLPLGHHATRRHPQNEEMIIGNIRVNAIDMGGLVHSDYRAMRVRKQYFEMAAGIVFVIDAADQRRLTEAKVTKEKRMRG